MKATFAILAVLGLALVAAPAKADFVTTITVSTIDGSDSGSATFVIPTNPDDFKTFFALGYSAEIRGSQNQVLGTLDAFNAEMDVDPAVSLNFAVTAGSVDTIFTISSAIVSFPAFHGPIAFATAGVTVTDNNLNGATLTGLLTDGMAYQAWYNGSTSFATLIGGSVVAPAGGSLTAQDRHPILPIVYAPIYDTVSSINSEFSFKLSAHDQASGTSRFEVAFVPMPSAAWAGMALLGLVVCGRAIRFARA